MILKLIMKKMNSFKLTMIFSLNKNNFKISKNYYLIIELNNNN